MTNEKCPSCKALIGIESNPYDYDTVSYRETVKGKNKLRLEFIVVSCTKCKAVLGITR